MELGVKDFCRLVCKLYSSLNANICIYLHGVVCPDEAAARAPYIRCNAHPVVSAGLIYYHIDKWQQEENHCRARRPNSPALMVKIR